MTGKGRHPVAGGGGVILTGKTAGVTLSGGGLIMTANAGLANNNGAQSSTSHTAGKYYTELRLSTLAGTSPQVGFGIGNSSFSLDSVYLGGDANSYSLYCQNGAFYHNGPLYNYGVNMVTGDVIGLALDLTNLHLFMRYNNNFWNAASGTDPTDPADANAIAVTAGTWFIYVSVQANSDGSVMTVNFGATTYAFTPPVGYGAW
jgi:hypothetical protein